MGFGGHAKHDHTNHNGHYHQDNLTNYMEPRSACDDPVVMRFLQLWLVGLPGDGADYLVSALVIVIYLPFVYVPL